MVRFSVGDQLAIVADRKGQRQRRLLTITAVRESGEEISYCLRERGAPALWVRESHLLRLRPALEPPIGD